MPDIATAMDAATAAARLDVLAALRVTEPGPVGHGAIRLRGRDDPPPAVAEDAPEEPYADARRAGRRARRGRARRGTIRLRTS